MSNVQTSFKFVKQRWPEPDFFLKVYLLNIYLPAKMKICDVYIMFTGLMFTFMFMFMFTDVYIMFS